MKQENGVDKENYIVNYTKQENDVEQENGVDRENVFVFGLYFFVFWAMGLFFSHFNSFLTLSTFCVLTFFLPDLC